MSGLRFKARWLLLAATVTAILAFAPSSDVLGGIAGCGTSTASAGFTGCCMYCTRGKACGNSCIARWKTCHQPIGCACDANTSPNRVARTQVDLDVR